MYILKRTQSDEQANQKTSVEESLAQRELELPAKPNRPKKIYTQKQWNKFSIQSQQVQTRRYDIILSDYETGHEKRKKIISLINFKNFDKGMSKFNNVQKTFWSNWDKGFSKAGMSNKKQ